MPRVTSSPGSSKGKQPEHRPRVSYADFDDVADEAAELGGEELTQSRFTEACRNNPAYIYRLTGKIMDMTRRAQTEIGEFVTIGYVSGSFSLGRETTCLAESYHVGGCWIDEADDGTKHSIHEEKRRIVDSPKTRGSVVLISPCGSQAVIRSPRALCNPRPHRITRGG